MKILEEIIKNRRYVFHDRFNSWEEAVRASCIPLIEERAINEEYVEKVIDSINDYGPYIIICPDVAMPHSALGHGGVSKCAVSFMKLEHPVYFEEGNEEKKAKVFFTLAADNPDRHLENMEKLTNILINNEILEEIKKVKNFDDLKNISEKYKI